ATSGTAAARAPRGEATRPGRQSHRSSEVGLCDALYLFHRRSANIMIVKIISELRLTLSAVRGLSLITSVGSPSPRAWEPSLFDKHTPGWYRFYCDLRGRVKFPIGGHTPGPRDQAPALRAAPGCTPRFLALNSQARR